MDVEQAIGSQRVARRFSDQPLPDDALAAILNAARLTGSSKNAVGDYAGHLAGATLAIALITPDPAAGDRWPRWSATRRGRADRPIRLPQRCVVIERAGGQP